MADRTIAGEHAEQHVTIFTLSTPDGAQLTLHHIGRTARQFTAPSALFIEQHPLLLEGGQLGTSDLNSGEAFCESRRRKGEGVRRDKAWRRLAGNEQAEETRHLNVKLITSQP